MQDIVQTAPLVLPPRVRNRARIGVAAPAGAVNKADLETGCRQLKALGYEVVYSESIFERDLYFAGSVERRLRELEELWMRDDVDAVFCARGGYGCNYILPLLDFEAMIARPKILVGYSDVTSLLTAFADKGMATFHGPMVAKDFARANGIETLSLRTMLNGAPLELNSWMTGMRSVRDGEAEGRFYGGCLSMLVASLGTPYEIQTRDTILLVEDINVPAYQLDRMLMHLKLAGKLDDVRGFVFGEFADCLGVEGGDYDLDQVILRVLGEYEVPIAFGLHTGHVSANNITVPIGTPARLSVASDEVLLSFSAATLGA